VNIYAGKRNYYNYSANAKITTSMIHKSFLKVSFSLRHLKNW